MFFVACEHRPGITASPDIPEERHAKAGAESLMRSNPAFRFMASCFKKGIQKRDEPDVQLHQKGP